MLGSIKDFFTGKSLKSFEEKADKINALEPEISSLSDDELKAESLKLKEHIGVALDKGNEKESDILNEILPRAFALAREGARRTLGQRAFDVQLMGGAVIHKGAVAEMMTGEGKTLAGVAPAYLNALTGKGVHIVTVNEYLARRDAVWMGQVYRALGLSVGVLVPNAAFIYDPLYKAPEEGPEPNRGGKNKGSGKEGAASTQNPRESALLDKERDETGSFIVQQEFLRPATRREAYEADITYGTNHEFGFDYLRDNLVRSVEERVQRGHHFAIIDEVDSILIDEARTPLIIAGADAQSSDAYKVFARVAALLIPEEDYEVDEKRKSVSITDAGVEKIEKTLNISNIYAPQNIRLVHYLEESVKAKALFKRDKDYVVKNGEIIIVDEFTGRLLAGRRYQAGLHQAIEAKEGVKVKEESRTYAKISIQNYFRMYEKISGMTGTAQTSAEEFHKVYELEVVSIPTNKPVARRDMNDLIYKTFGGKIDAVVRDVKERNKRGQPILIGTTSIAKNEIFSAALSQAGIPHEVLNAKNNEREGAIIAQAGKPGAVTVATNVAGRGVDIILGGNPPKPEDAEKTRELGGLHVIGTERHEARRIDDQLRGRSGRQGDPGSTQFFLSAEDDLLRIFGGDRLKNMMVKLNVPDDQPIEFGFITKAVAQAQDKVEGANFDLRKHLLEYDDVLNKQRAAVYRRRSEMMSLIEKDKLADFIAETAITHFENAIEPTLASISAAENLRPQGSDGQESGTSGAGDENAGPTKADVLRVFREAGILDKDMEKSIFDDPDQVKNILKEKSNKAAEVTGAKNQLVSMIDLLWMNHLEELEAIQESVGLRAYGQHDPLVEYREEAHRLYKSFWNNFNGMVFANSFKMIAGADGSGSSGSSDVSSGMQNPAIAGSQSDSVSGAIGRNDPCPCGSGKKWKKCGLLNTEEHRANMARKLGGAHEVTGG